MLSVGSNPHYFRDVILPWALEPKNDGNNIVADSLDTFTKWKTLLDESDKLKLQLGIAWRKDVSFLSARGKYLKKFAPPPLIA